jgi:hypothetical protein
MSLSDQLKEYIENTPKEQLERDWFEISCRCEGIDPNKPNAKRELKKIRLKNKYWYPFRRILPVLIDGFVMITNSFCAGVTFNQEYYWVSLFNLSVSILFFVVLWHDMKKYWY